ncbi:helix-turn-helix transcriptional regulator [Lactobacillus reuteri]|nr:helix-turn-helix transcriptional regulator [Limosilactobacillus reuteri]NMV50072.1 helix-turn-helix transcriptional regulator [Limosilactobacillus reuteri]NMV59836.1 helix-turn-helix transcriptional regulator [Limosilactobacillus reuteri]NMV61631.1 helix-turn-helix transcriptional regulator [Limosilactobacillus reuteri]NMV63374.1 helix-turn-helix transcriptional regulator [Limosilactobacillus reuteri]
MSELALRKWENDFSVLSYKDMLRISKLYGVPLDYIFGPNNAFSEINS